jgi:TIR domain
MSPRVFVSHSHRDAGSYSALCLALDHSSIRRWDVRNLSVGLPLAEGLRAAIDACDVCVFLATTNSVNSEWCHAELGAFWGATKRVIVYLAEPSLTEEQLPPQFRGDLVTDDATRLIEAIRTHQSGPVRILSDGYCVNLGSLHVRAAFGRLELMGEFEEDCLLALPANEFFDDECIDDKRSALGAFVQYHFPGRTLDVQALVATALAGEVANQVDKYPGQVAASSGIGKCVYLVNPLDKLMRLAMVAVTTQRANAGIQARASYVFEAALSLSQLMANHRLTRLYLPVIGCGHGGLKPEVALICLLLAFVELQGQLGHRHLREINIIIHRPTPDAVPAISESFVRSVLKFVAENIS